MCLVCNQQVSVLKEYNIRRHNETHHEEKYHHLKGQLRKEEIDKLLAGLKKQQSTYTFSREISDAALKASNAAEVVFPEKQSAFANISLSRIG